MSKCVLAPDSFKGTLSAREVCAIMAQAILESEPDAEMVSIPAADGGEGSVDCMLEAGAAKRCAWHQ